MSDAASTDRSYSFGSALSPEATIDRLEWLAWFTDSAVRIPGTSRSVGADSMLSIIPGVGTFLGSGLSLYLLAEALRHGAPPRLLTRMGLNIAADTAVGAVPILGFFFDMFFKANQRNLTLLRTHMQEIRQ